MKPRIFSTARLSFPLASAIASLLAAPSASALDGTWLGATGNWTDAGTWSGGTIPDGTGFTANFTGVDIASDQTITLAADRTIGNITFTDATTSSNNLLISGANLLTLDVASGAPTIDVTQSGRTLTINSKIAGTDGLQKIGVGGLTLNGSAVNTFTGGLNINRGTLALDYANLATPTDLVAATNALQINNGALTITGQNVAATTSSQTFASTSLGAGANAINITKGALATSATLDLKALTINAGSATIINTGTFWASTTALPVNETVKISAGGSVPALPAAATNAYVNAGLFVRATAAAGSARYVAVDSAGNLLGQYTGSPVLVATTNTPTIVNQLSADLAFTTTTANSYALILNANSNPRTLTLAANGTYTLNGIVQNQPTNGSIINAGTGTSNIIIGSEKNLVINMDHTAPLTINAPIANNGGGASALTLASTIVSGTPGSVTLGGANTFTGATTIVNGSLLLNNATALGGNSPGTNGTSAISMAAGSTIRSDLSGGATIYAPITLSGVGNVNLSVGGPSGTTANFNIFGAIGGTTNNLVFTTTTGSLNNATTIIRLNATSNYAGNTTITVGNSGNNNLTVRSVALNSLSPTTALTLDGGTGSNTAAGRTVTFDLNGNNQTLAGLTNTTTGHSTSRNQRVTNSGSLATLTINNSADFTYGGLVTDAEGTGSAQIVGAVALTKSGAGTFTLAAGAANTFTGDTKVLGGILSVGHPTSLQNSTFDTANSILGDATNGLRSTVTTLTLGGLTGNKNFANVFTTSSGGYSSLTSLTLNSGTGVTNSYAANIGDGATGLNLIKSGAGTQILTATQTYTGTTTGSAGTLIASTAAALPGYNAAGKVIFNGGTIAVQVGGGGWTTGEVDTLLANATKTSGYFGIDTTIGNLVQWAPFTTTNLGSTLGLNKLGANNLTLDQANTFSTPTTVIAGTLTLANALALQNSALVTTSAAGSVVLSGVTTLTLGGLSGTTGDLATVITGYGGVTGITLNTPAGVSLTYGGIIGEGATGMTLTKTGAGIQTLTGANAYTGTTQIDGGILVFGNKASKTAATATAGPAGIIGLGVKPADAAFYSETDVATLFNSDTLTGFDLDPALTSGVAISNTSGAAFDQSVALTGGRSLTKLGGNTVTLSMANSYTGATNVLAGALSITNNDSLGTTAGVTTITGATGNTSLVIGSATTDLTVAENINFNGTVAGRARLDNTSALNHTLTGNIDVTSDTQIVEFNSASTGSITLTGNFTGNFTNGVGLSLLLRGTSTSATNRLTGNVAITGGLLVKTDAGTWTIGAPGKTISAEGGIGAANGILKLGAADVLVDSSVLYLGNSTGGSNGSFDLNGFNETIGGIIQNGTSGAKSITNSGAAAVLTVNNATDYSTGNLVALTGALGLTKDGIGTLTLAAANTYSGNTVINAGTLALADNAQLKFVLGASTVNNSLTGAGTATLDGDFVIDTTAADALPSGTWNLENVSTLTGPYGSTFTVVGFVNAGGDKWTKANGATTYTFDETTGVLKLEPAGFSSWITGTFTGGATVPALKQGPNDDPDNDGISNLVEYAVAGQDPTVSNATIGSFNGTTLSFTKRLDASGLTYAIQDSTDLGVTDVWAEVTNTPPNIYVNDGTTISYTLTPGTPPRNFIRLQVLSN